MGGAISTLLAERPDHTGLRKGHFDAVLALGAALNFNRTKEPTAPEFTYRPLIPIVYLSNHSETGPILDYISRARKEVQLDLIKGEDNVTVPALWEVARPGHGKSSPRCQPGILPIAY